MKKKTELIVEKIEISLLGNGLPAERRDESRPINLDKKAAGSVISKS